jgi:hypothetical protein
LEQDRGWQPGVKARLLYDHLARAASPEPRSEGLGSSPEDRRGPPRRLISNGRKLAADAGCAYSLVVKYLGELEEAGWLQRVRHKHGDTEYVLTRPELATQAPDQAASSRACNPPSSTLMAPTPPANDAPADPQHSPASSAPSEPPAGPFESSTDKVQSSDSSIKGSEKMNFEESPNLQGSDFSINSGEKMNFEDLAAAQSSDFLTQNSETGNETGLKVQSSKFKVQSSANAYVPPVRTLLINQQHACMPADQNLNFELLADFRKRVNGLLAEFGISNPKRKVLADHIVALAAKSFSAERAEEILADMRKAQERTAARKDVKSAPAVMVKILEEYAETGQMVLFEIAPDVPVEHTEDAARRRADRERKQAELQQARGKNHRRPQAVFTDADRAEKERLARERLAGKGKS